VTIPVNWRRSSGPEPQRAAITGGAGVGVDLVVEPLGCWTFWRGTWHGAVPNVASAVAATRLWPPPTG
jgi:hypothetical protein